MIVAAGAVGAAPHLQNAGLVWIVPVAIAAGGAWFFMDNLATAKSNFKDQLVIVRRKHTWVMSLLYIGTFGSFVGYSAAFPLLLKTQFPDVTSNLAFLGPLVGSLARPLGGKIADRLGGSRVTFWNFVIMALAAAGVLYCVEQKSFAGFMMMFLVLFIASGVGNGSTFRMIPVIFRADALRRAAENGANEDTERTLRIARRDTAAVLGFSSAIGAIGGFFIPRQLGASIKATGGPQSALSWFVLYYFICLVTTWWYYRRRSFLVTRVPSLAQANA
jgi:NNP family nitrate/nitrite transporter-like MFS transporter